MAILWKIEDMGSEDESIDIDEKVKIVVKSTKTMSFCERMRRVWLHRLPLKEQKRLYNQLRRSPLFVSTSNNIR